jgi:hypothetical protein
MLVFDVYLDRVNFDLHMEADLEKEEVDKINTVGAEGFKYLTVKNISANTSLEKFFNKIKKELKETYGIVFDSKVHSIAVELENGDKVVEEKGNALKKTNTLADHHITRFSTIKFFASGKENT